MSSNSEYEQQQFWEPKLIWKSGKDLLPNPKLYKITNSNPPEWQDENGWFKIKQDKIIEECCDIHPDVFIQNKPKICDNKGQIVIFGTSNKKQENK